MDPVPNLDRQSPAEFGHERAGEDGFPHAPQLARPDQKDRVARRYPRVRRADTRRKQVPRERHARIDLDP